MKKLLVIVSVALTIVLLVLCLLYEDNWNRQSIQRWADEHNVIVVDLEEAGFLETGPYYVRNKGQKIYRGKLKDRNYEVWFRTGMWGVEAYTTSGNEVQ